MKKAIARFILRLFRWNIDFNIPKGAQHCVMAAAPHTSNWDFFFMRLSFFVLDIPIRVAIKNDWTRFPFSLLMKPLGALGIDRSPKSKNPNRKSQTEQMAAFFTEYDSIALAIAPEGTRSLREEWKMGFYYIAKQANVPIAFGYLDYEKRISGVGGVLYPSDDIAADMKKMMAFYSTIAPCHPELFSLDKRYV